MTPTGRPTGAPGRSSSGSGSFAVPPCGASPRTPRSSSSASSPRRPRPAGRTQGSTATPVAPRRASSASSPCSRRRGCARPRRSPRSSRSRPALVVLADYGQIVPPALLDLPHGALNLHPSLLPRHRGASPIPATILAGDAETGVTLMRMDAGPRHGPDRRAASASPLDGTRDARRTSRRAGRASRPSCSSRSLGPWLGGELAAVPQADEGVDADPAAAPRGRAPRSGAAGRGARAAGPRLPAVARDVPRGRRRARWWSTAARGRAVGAGDAPGASSPDEPARRSRRPTGRLVLATVSAAGRRPMSGADCLRGRRARSARVAPARSPRTPCQNRPPMTMTAGRDPVQPPASAPRRATRGRSAGHRAA